MWWREYSVVEVKVYLTSVCYRTGRVFCYSGYLEWLVYQTRPISLAHRISRVVMYTKLRC